MIIKLAVRKLINKLLHPNRYSSEAFVNHLKSKGCIVGKGTYFFSPLDTQVDVNRPHLLEIGEYCKITSGVQILTHDYSRSVIRKNTKKIINSAKPTRIGNNVFIGIKSILLPGVIIGNNVVIAAGSVVSRDVPDNVVVGGNPARVIMSIEEYMNKREEKYLSEAVSYAKRIMSATGNQPNIKDMGDFFPLYCSGAIDDLLSYGLNVRCSGDDIDDYKESFLNNVPRFKGFDEFFGVCEQKLALTNKL